jgi:putative spermidine/putrescine transport system permease protein
VTARMRLSERLPTYALIAFVVLFFTYMILPILIVVTVAFTSTNYVVFPIVGFSGRWFEKVIHYRAFMESFVTSIELAFASAALGALLGVPAALILARSPSKFAAAISGFLLSPLSLPAIVLGFSMMFFLSDLGLPISFLSLLLAHTVVAIPYLVRTAIGVYRSTSTSLEEAAAVLGASRTQIFFHVTLPLIRSGIFAGSLFAILVSMDNLPLSYFFGTARVNTLPVVVLSYLENQFDPAVAAISTLQLLFAIASLLVLDRAYGLRRLVMAR